MPLADTIAKSLVEITKVTPGPGLATVEVTVKNRRIIIPASYTIAVTMTGSKGGEAFGKGKSERDRLRGGMEGTKTIIMDYTKDGADRVAGLMGPTLVKATVVVETARVGLNLDTQSFDVLIAYAPIKPGPTKERVPPTPSTPWQVTGAEFTRESVRAKSEAPPDQSGMALPSSLSDTQWIIRG